MKITVANYKGGVGKSMISYQLISGFGYFGVELDPAGSMAERIPNKIHKVLPKEKIPNLSLMEEDIIIDCAGVFSEEQNKKIADAAKYTDLFIVPYIPTLENVQSTVDTLNFLKQFDIPILMAVNQYQKESDVEDSLFVFREVLQQTDLDYFKIPLSVALQTSINLNKSIVELSQQRGIASYSYKKIRSIFEELHQKIQSYK